MKSDDWLAKAENYLETLCAVKPNRRTGSAGNREATNFFSHTLRSLGYEVDDAPFDCLDYISGEVFLRHSEDSFEVFISPYSLDCDCQAELSVVSTVDELRRSNCSGKLLLLKGEICQEQLMPKNFVFYNPETHQEIIGLLEKLKPAAIITATTRNPELVGALYPFPLILDGDFDLPNVYCKETVGETLKDLEGKVLHLKVDSQRIPSSASNPIARKQGKGDKKIVITAHIDGFENTPGALDNASGVVVMMLLAEMLADYQGNAGIEMIAFNGEDHYSVAGQMDYLRRFGKELANIMININIDDAGSKTGKTVYSFYECPQDLETQAELVFQQFDGLVRGEPWPQGDHMIFVQNNIPALAFTSENMAYLMQTVTHTALDTPDQIDYRKLVELAESLNAFIRSF